MNNKVFENSLKKYYFFYFIDKPTNINYKSRPPALPNIELGSRPL